MVGKKRSHQEWVLGSRFQVPGLSRYMDGGVVQKTDPGRRPSLGGKIMSLVLGALNVRCFGNLRGNVKLVVICPSQEVSKASPSENTMIRMEVFDFELSEKTDQKSEHGLPQRVYLSCSKVHKHIDCPL